MFSILLAIIYLAFISLGLPDSILGSAWPSMYGQFDVPVSYAGILSMIISAGTIVSSMNADKLITRWGTGLVTACSVAMTAAALFGFSLSGSFAALCLWGIPYGLGAGSVDAALNNFVALHYESRHMNWLHCFWGIGASAGPYIMGLCLTRNLAWNMGYRVIGFMQVALVAGLFLSLPFWKRAKGAAGEGEEKRKHALKLKEILRLPGAGKVLGVFFCYCALEASTGLWASSYLVLAKGLDSRTAAKWAALFYLGITAGRFASGFIADRVGDKNMVRLGLSVGVAGVAALLLPFGAAPAFAGLILIGLGCAPVYPSLLHETPENFGQENSQAVMGVQMACAYVGTTLMPPLFGAVAEVSGVGIYPFYLLAITAVMFLLSEGMNRIMRLRIMRQKEGGKRQDA